jgi:hypothetical protein
MFAGVGCVARKGAELDPERVQVAKAPRLDEAAVAFDE